MKNEIIDIKIDRDGNKWETKIMTNFAGEKYKILYKNGKTIDILGRYCAAELPVVDMYL